MEQILLNHPWTFSFPSGNDAYFYFIAIIKGNDYQWSTGRVWLFQFGEVQVLCLS